MTATATTAPQPVADALVDFAETVGRIDTRLDQQDRRLDTIEGGICVLGETLDRDLEDLRGHQ